MRPPSSSWPVAARAQMGGQGWAEEKQAARVRMGGADAHGVS
jgi:hypothetical protein